MGDGSTVRDGGRSDPPSKGIGSGTETANDGGASARNDGGGFLGRCRMAGRRYAVVFFDVLGHIWFNHIGLSFLVFVGVYTPIAWGLWRLHNDHVWLAAIAGAVVFWATTKVTVAFAVAQTVQYYQDQQRAFHAHMQAQALAQMQVDGDKPN